MQCMNIFINIQFKVILLLTILFLGGNSINSQEIKQNTPPVSQFRIHEKGKFFLTWGYNRSWYEKSDIHFTGQGHDFIAYDVKATDRPSKLSLSYITPTEWSIPQFNFHIGYFFTNKYSVSIGWDHMKYVATNYQIFKVYGYMDPSKVPDPTMRANMQAFNDIYAPDGLYNNVEVVQDPAQFLSYEHTDGFNYASVDLDRYDKLWQSKKFDKLAVTFVSGVGLGTIVPRTDCRLYGGGSNHFWNLAGWGAHARIGLQINFMKHLYLESNLKYGYVNMVNVHTSDYYDIDKAQQKVVFYEFNGALGVRF